MDLAFDLWLAMPERGQTFMYARDAAYILSAALFILGISRLSSPHTARNGNRLAALGMAIAMGATLASLNVQIWWTLVLGTVVGAAIGLVLARSVKFTAMPQLVAIFNGLGGGASALLASAEATRATVGDVFVTALGGVEAASVTLSVLIGAVTFTGSLIAFGKLQGLIPSQPVIFPFRNIFNGTLLIAVVVVAGIGAFTFTQIPADALMFLLIAGVLAAILGISLVLPIGGADMPVVVAILNSYSGLAAAAAGFALGNTILIVAGSLVGASGLILTRIMTRAMNRSLMNVMLGGFGNQGNDSRTTVDETKAVRSVTAEDAAIVMGYARSVIFVPGYGLAVAQAQHAVRELADLLKERGTQVRYAIHPVAGRMPGHMNILLAEANVPYEDLKSLEEINNEFNAADVAVVIGANDVVNPAARQDASSPIYGMPILNADRAKSTLILKRSLASGFSGIENDLFYSDKSMMLFGDAKDSVESMSKEIKEL